MYHFKVCSLDDFCLLFENTFFLEKSVSAAGLKAYQTCLFPLCLMHNWENHIELHFLSSIPLAIILLYDDRRDPVRVTAVLDWSWIHATPSQ